MKAWIDGDIIVYSCGSAADNRYYTVSGYRFDYKKEALAFCEETETPIKMIEFHKEPTPVEFSLGNIKGLLESIFLDVGVEGGTIYLTPEKGNFREDLATIAPYKGQRDSDGKPCWYNEMRQYLVEEWGAIIPSNCEADDMMGVSQCLMISRGHGDGSVIVTTDKDLNMIPGWHYNWQKKQMYFVDQNSADLFFFTQLLTGDPTDNIKGVPGLGPKKAVKLLNGVRSNRDRMEICEEAYRRVYEDDYMKFLEENADLLWIWRGEAMGWRGLSENEQRESEGTEATAVGEGQAA